MERLSEVADHSVDLILCDIPYGTTQNKWDTIIPLDRMWAEIKRVRKDNAAALFTAQTPFDKVLGASNLEELRYEWIWEKEKGTGHLQAKKAPMKSHENVLVFYKMQPTYNPQMRIGEKPYVVVRGSKKSDNYGADKGATTNNDGKRYPLSVIMFPRDREKMHPTQKPVALMEYLIKTYSNKGDTVLDFTMGSGTTGVACMRQERDFIGIEKDPLYYAMAKTRIEAEFPQQLAA
jgi:site-specific DNA-methyltransferase (adenine-specific)